MRILVTSQRDIYIINVSHPDPNTGKLLAWLYSDLIDFTLRHHSKGCILRLKMSPEQLARIVEKFNITCAHQGCAARPIQKVGSLCAEHHRAAKVSIH